MTSAIVTAILPILVRLIGMFLDTSNASQATKKKYLDFIESASKDFSSSASLKKSFDAQKARMDLEEQNGNLPNP